MILSSVKIEELENKISSIESKLNFNNSEIFFLNNLQKDLKEKIEKLEKLNVELIKDKTILLRK